MSDHARRIAALMLAGLLAAPVWSQQADDTDDEQDTTETEPEAANEEQLDIDDTSYLDIDEDDFRPSEEIPADQSIAFPTDI